MHAVRATHKGKSHWVTHSPVVFFKKGVVPSVFRNAPKYLLTNSGTPRSTSKATATSRREQAAQELQRLEQSFLAEDDISELSITELKSRLDSETTGPQGFSIRLTDETLLMYMKEIVDDWPRIKACITNNNNNQVYFVLQATGSVDYIWSRTRPRAG